MPRWRVDEQKLAGSHGQDKDDLSLRQQRELPVQASGFWAPCESAALFARLAGQHAPNHVTAMRDGDGLRPGEPFLFEIKRVF